MAVQISDDVGKGGREPASQPKKQLRRRYHCPSDQQHLCTEVLVVKMVGAGFPAPQSDMRNCNLNICGLLVRL